MSGSNGPDYSFGAGAGGANCAGLTRSLALQAADPNVVAVLTVGITMDLFLHDGVAPTIAVITAAGQEAGAVMPDQALIDCLRRDVQFVAEVLSVRGGQVLLTVRSK